MSRAEINTIISSGLDGGYWGNSSKRQALQEAAVVAITKGDLSDDAYTSNSSTNEKINNSNSIKFKSPIVTPDKKKRKTTLKDAVNKCDPKILFMNDDDSNNNNNNNYISNYGNDANKKNKKQKRQKKKTEDPNTKLLYNEFTRANYKTVITSSTITTSSMECTDTTTSIDDATESSGSKSSTKINNKRKNANYTDIIKQMFQNLEYEKDLAQYKVSLMNDYSFVREVTLFLQSAITMFWKIHADSENFDEVLEEEETFMTQAFYLYIRQSIEKRPRVPESSSQSQTVFSPKCQNQTKSGLSIIPTESMVSKESMNQFRPVNNRVSKESMNNETYSPTDFISFSANKDDSINTPFFCPKGFTPVPTPDFFDDDILDANDNWIGDNSWIGDTSWFGDNQVFEF